MTNVLTFKGLKKRFPNSYIFYASFNYLIINYFTLYLNIKKKLKVYFMYLFTQAINEELSFDIFYNSIKGKKHLLSINNDTQQLEKSIILLISISFGIELKAVVNLRWSELLIIGSENDAVVKEEFFFRKYFMPLNQDVRNIISDVYYALGFPLLDTYLLNKDFISNENPTELEKSIFIQSGLNSNINWFLSNYRNFDFNQFPKFIYGRKVIEVCGYNNVISKNLKQHFGFKKNEELFKFLNFPINSPIKFELSKIKITDGKYSEYNDGKKRSLNYTKNIFKLKDKNFNLLDNLNEPYCFQSFEAFSNFLISGDLFNKNLVYNSVRILLLIGLYNGIRLSSLLKLRWIDILIDKTTDKFFEVKKSIILNDKIINIGSIDDGIIVTHLGKHFLANGIKTHKARTKNTMFYKESIDLNTPIFVTNHNTPITQPSLLREIKKVLELMNFPHFNIITTKSPMIMFGRKIIEIRGDHKPTINALKEHFNFRTKKELFEFLKIDYNSKKDDYEFKGKVRKTIFDEILYDK